jgi:hypothetical protein
MPSTIDEISSNKSSTFASSGIGLGSSLIGFDPSWIGLVSGNGFDPSWIGLVSGNGFDPRGIGLVSGNGFDPCGIGLVSGNGFFDEVNGEEVEGLGLEGC